MTPRVMEWWGAGRERCPPTTPYPVYGKCLGTGMEAPSLHGGCRPVSLWGSTSRRGESLYSSFFHVRTEKQLQRLRPRPGTQPGRVHPFAGQHPALTPQPPPGVPCPRPPKHLHEEPPACPPTSTRGTPSAAPEPSSGESPGRRRQRQPLPSPARAASGTRPEPQEPPWPPLPDPRRERQGPPARAARWDRPRLPGAPEPPARPGAASTPTAPGRLGP